jgi:hypothetical protein
MVVLLAGRCLETEETERGAIADTPSGQRHGKGPLSKPGYVCGPFLSARLIVHCATVDHMECLIHMILIHRLHIVISSS